jgi:hypothetical protein
MYSPQQADRMPDSGSRAGLVHCKIARDAARSFSMMTKRRVHLVVFLALIALGNGSLRAAAPGSASVTGVVRDAAGVPQIGSQVQLLRPDLSVITSVYTGADGRYLFSSVFPGRYAVKAMGDWFLPSLRENVRVRSKTIVNLTLNSLYEAMQWLPAEPRSGNTQKDDWAWTLKSAANRPLLRWLEDGPLVVVSDGSGAHPRLKARLMATGQEGAFGESGERITAAVEETPSNSRELLASVDFDPGSDAATESMLGFRQDLGFAGSVQSVAAVALHPEMSAGEGEGLDEAVLRSWQTMRLGDEIEAEAGSSELWARLGGPNPEAIVELLPFASASWRNGKSTIRYRMTTVLPGPSVSQETETGAWLPALSARNGRLAIEHGNHQEIGWERSTERSGVAFMVFSDRIDNPVLEAVSRSAGSDSAAAATLLDPANGLLRATGPRFSNTGVEAFVERGLSGGNTARLSFANGEAIVLPLSQAAPQPATLSSLLAGAHPRHIQEYAISLSGTLEGTGTRWRASYRWQPEETVTQVAPFAENAAAPYLNLRLRQPIHLSGNHTGGLEAVIDLRNLLAEGYRPYLLSDGSTVIFAQEQRNFSAGLIFNF